MQYQESFLLRELAALDADLDRFQRMLDGLRRLTMNQHQCSDIEAELHLQSDRVWKQLRRQQAAARRAWLSFNRTLEKHRKANPAPETTTAETAVPGSNGVASPQPTNVEPQSSAIIPPPAQTTVPQSEPQLEL